MCVCVKDGVVTSLHMVCDKEAADGRGGGGRYRSKNKNTTQRCGENGKNNQVSGSMRLASAEKRCITSENGTPTGSISLPDRKSSSFFFLAAKECAPPILKAKLFNTSESEPLCATTEADRV